MKFSAKRKENWEGLIISSHTYILPGFQNCLPSTSSWIRDYEVRARVLMPSQVLKKWGFLCSRLPQHAHSPASLPRVFSRNDWDPRNPFKQKNYGLRGRFAVSPGTMLLNEISMAFTDSTSCPMTNRRSQVGKSVWLVLLIPEWAPPPWERELKRWNGVPTVSCWLLWLRQCPGPGLLTETYHTLYVSSSLRRVRQPSLGLYIRRLKVQRDEGSGLVSQGWD